MNHWDKFKNHLRDACHLFEKKNHLMALQGHDDDDDDEK